MRPGGRYHEVRLFEFALLFDQNRRRWSRLEGLNCLWSYSRATFATVKRDADQFDQALVIDIPRGRDDQICVRELARVEPDGDFVIESRNGFPRAFDRPSERLVGKVSSVEKLSEQFVRRVLDHLHLFEDDFLLAFEVFLFKTRVRNEISE
jgi:hypothetical protein